MKNRIICGDKMRMCHFKGREIWCLNDLWLEKEKESSVSAAGDLKHQMTHKKVEDSWNFWQVFA